MYALVTDGSITKTLSGNRGITIGDIQYPQNIFTLWSAAEKEAIGIYEVVFDNTNKKDEAYYNNTNQTFAFAGGAVTASYGSATAKALTDTLFTAQDEIDGKGTEGEVAAKGLKTKHKRTITAVPSAITTYRAAVRTKSGQMETAIDNAADVDALKALYEYVNTGTEENPVMERPLGEFPEAV